MVKYTWCLSPFMQSNLEALYKDDFCDLTLICDEDVSKDALGIGFNVRLRYICIFKLLSSILLADYN
jgi:hypothetical protein